MSTGACFWFFVQTVGNRNAVYATAVLMGCGGSVMLVTSLALISELIAYDKVRSLVMTFGLSHPLLPLNVLFQSLPRCRHFN